MYSMYKRDTVALHVHHRPLLVDLLSRHGVSTYAAPSSEDC